MRAATPSCQAARQARQLIRETDPLGRIVAYSYDDAGRLASMWQPGNVAATQYKYDSANNLRKTIDPLNHATEWKYDERFRVTDEIDANNKTTKYAYTNANELQKLTDPNLNDTTWVYDVAGRVRSETNELGHVRTFTYDAYGRLAEKTDRNGRVTKYEYDRLHYLSAEKWYVGASLQRTITYDFDKVGNLEYVSDPSATYDPEYDALGRQTGVTQTIVGLTPNVRFDRTYDAADRMSSSSAKIAGVADYTNNYSFDAIGRLIRITQSSAGGHAVANKRDDFTYNAASQSTSTLRYASTTTASPVAMTQHSYDEHGRLIFIDHNGIAPGSTFGEAHGYNYDAANRLTRYTNLIDDVIADYAYDNRDQLTEADHFDDAYDESYGYDNNGNRNADGAQAHQIGTNNRLTNDGKYTYLYDAEGNRTWRTDMVTGDRTEYQWDHRNRLTLVTDYNANGTPWIHSDDTSRDIVWNYYDAQNQLIRHVYYAINGEIEQLVHTSFVYDNGQMVLRFDKAGQPGAADLSHRYLWGAAVDELLADEQVHDLFNSANNETLWALTDHLGSVRDVVDTNGDLRIHRNFDAFGNITGETHYNTSGAPATTGQAGYVDEAFAFTGRYFDKDTGLQNNLNRWYDPTVGRWMSEDPIGFAAGDANLYRHVGNSPTMQSDPNGLVAETPWLVARAIGIRRLPPVDQPRRLPPVTVEAPPFGEWTARYEESPNGWRIDLGFQSDEGSNLLDKLQELPVGKPKPIPGTKPIFGTYQPAWQFDKGEIEYPRPKEIWNDPSSLVDPDKWKFEVIISIGVIFE